MKKNISILSAMLLVGALNASADDKGAVYVAPPTEGSDTVAYNLSVSPVIKRDGDKLVFVINNKETYSLPIEEGTKIFFGKTIIMGDVNRDNEVTKADAVAVVENYIGKKDDIDKNAADVNYDGQISVADANNITNMTK